MTFTRFAAWTVATGLAACSLSAAYGQAYPNKPVRLVTSPIGGGNDFVARLVAPGIAGPLGQPVVIENRPTRALGETLAKAPPDGYTLLVMSAGLWLFPYMGSASYDVERDFAPVSLAVRSPNVVVVHPTLPAKSVKELIAIAKAKPDQLAYSVGGLGGMSHLSVELFKIMAGVKMVLVNYKTGAQEITDLISGQVQLAFNPAGSAAPHVKSGKLKGLAVTTTERSALFPDLPTVAASGLPGYEAVSTYGVFAPAKTPDAIIRRINQEVVRFVNTPDAKAKFLSGAVESVGSTPEVFAASIKSDMNKWGKIIRDAGIRDE